MYILSKFIVATINVVIVNLVIDFNLSHFQNIMIFNSCAIIFILIDIYSTVIKDKS